MGRYTEHRESSRAEKINLLEEVAKYKAECQSLQEEKEALKVQYAEARKSLKSAKAELILAEPGKGHIIPVTPAKPKGTAKPKEESSPGKKRKRDSETTPKKKGRKSGGK